MTPIVADAELTAAICPLCHTTDRATTTVALESGATWTCARCGHFWTARRLATAAAYAAYCAS